MRHKLIVREPDPVAKALGVITPLRVRLTEPLRAALDAEVRRRKIAGTPRANRHAVMLDMMARGLGLIVIDNHATEQPTYGDTK